MIYKYFFPLHILSFYFLKWVFGRTKIFNLMSLKISVLFFLHVVLLVLNLRVYLVCQSLPFINVFRSFTLNITIHVLELNSTIL